MQELDIYKPRVEQGKSVRDSANQPVTSLVRQEDLAFCAARLLVASRLLAQDRPGLAELIEQTLSDLAAIQPEDAIKRVRDGRTQHLEEPVFWALCCHVLGQTLSEFSRETTPQMLTELRSSLPDWYSRFQDSFRCHKQPYKDPELLALMVYYTQSSIFHDKSAYTWVRPLLVMNVVDQSFCSDVALELAALAGGALDPQADLNLWRQLVLHLECVDKVPPNAAFVRQAIGGPSTQAISFSSERINQRTLNPVQSSNSKSLADPDDDLGPPKKSRQLLESTVDAVAPFLPWLAVVAVGALCVAGFGMGIDWVFNTSPVGNQTLSQSYEQMRKQNEERSALFTEESTPAPLDLALATPSEPPLAVEQPTPVPTPEPSPTPVPTPAAPVFTARDGTPELAPAPPDLIAWAQGVIPDLSVHLKVARVNAIGYEKFGKLNGDPLVYVNPQNPDQALVYFPIRWMENDKEDPNQALEARMERQNGQWILIQAMRCTEMSPAGVERVQDVAEIAWATRIFIDNPFYP
jgi:hypothetical protein